MGCVESVKLALSPHHGSYQVGACSLDETIPGQELERWPSAVGTVEEPGPPANPLLPSPASPGHWVSLLPICMRALTLPWSQAGE